MRVAALQMRSGTEPDVNLDAIAQAVAEAAGQGARYIQTPEMSVSFAENREGLSRVALPFENNPHIGRLSLLAREHGVTLHIGSMAIAAGDRFLNRSILFAPDGQVAAVYDKIHLFDADPAGLNPYRESRTYAPGEAAVVADAGALRLGLTICYDVRFPALHRALARAGANVLAIPAAFTVPTGRAHWDILVRARAIETGCFVVAAAQGGQHQNGRSTFGHSMIVSPWGDVIAEAEGDAPTILFADLDLGLVTRARAQVPALDNARGFSLSLAGSMQNLRQEGSSPP